MARSPLLGQRIHIAGSIVEDLAVATGDDVRLAREFVVELVKALVRCGANFVVPVDAEPKRKADGLPICFDWLIWQTLRDNLIHRPAGVPGPLAIAVQHHKSEDQIPAEFVDLWDDLRGNLCLRRIEMSRNLPDRNVSHRRLGRVAGGRVALRSRRARPPTVAQTVQLRLCFPSEPLGLRGT